MAIAKNPKRNPNATSECEVEALICGAERQHVIAKDRGANKETDCDAHRPADLLERNDKPMRMLGKTPRN